MAGNIGAGSCQQALGDVESVMHPAGRALRRRETAADREACPAGSRTIAPTHIERIVAPDLEVQRDPADTTIGTGATA